MQYYSSYSCCADNTADPHDSLADKGRYRHDGRADKRRYRHNRSSDSLSLKIMLFTNSQTHTYLLSAMQTDK